METVSEDVVRGIVRSNRVRFPPAVPDVRQQVRDDVVDSPYVLRCQAAVGLQDNVCQVARCSQMGRVGLAVPPQGCRLVQPSDGRRVVAQGQNTREFLALGVVTAPAFEPYVHDHTQEFQQVVDSGVSVDNARFWDSRSPSLPCYKAVPPHPKGARV